MSAPTEKTQWGFTLIVTGLIVAFVGGVWGPTYWQIRSIHQQIAKAEGDLGLKRGRTDGLAELAHEVELLGQEVKSSSKIIPTHADLADVLRELSTQIEAEQLTSQGISTPATITSDDHTQMPVQLTVKGSSRAVFSLIARVEELPRLIQFDFLEIKRDEKAGGQVQASLKLTTYYGAQEAGRS